MTTSVPTLAARRTVWALSGRAAGGSSRRDRTSLSSATSRMGMAPQSFRVVNLEVHANVNDEHVHLRGSLTHPCDSWGEVPHRNNPPGAVVAGNPARVIKQVAELTCPPGWFEHPYTWPPYVAPEPFDPGDACDDVPPRYEPPAPRG